MLIANPIYDTTFKHLMKDTEIATFFIETLIQEPVYDVQMQPQEYTYYDKAEKLTFFRLDFVATIRSEDGSRRKILIEIQKAKNEMDVMRFRKYLGEHYKKEDTVDTTEGKITLALPIITIYLLGFKLLEIPTAAAKIGRQYIDLIENEVIPVKDEFVEQLTHDCIVVQLPRIQGSIKTKLEKLLSVFEQAHFVEAGQEAYKNYATPIDDNRIQKMVDVLVYAAADPEKRKELEAEAESRRILDAYYREKMYKIRKLERVLSENKRTISENKRTISEKERTISEKERTISEKDRIIAELQAKLEQKGG